MSQPPTTSARPTCAAIRPTGSRCRMAPLKGSAYCWNHDPSRSRDRTAARRRGGEATRTPPGTPVPLRDVGAIQRELEAVVGDTKMQPNSPDRSRTIIAALRLGLDVLAAGVWENRLAGLERRLGSLDSREAGGELWLA